VWGAPGLLVATPLTTVLVVLGKYVPGLSFFDTLLGSEPVLSPQSRLYQRLLALDADDSEEVVESFRAQHTLTQTFDQVLLPALAMSETDREAGNLTRERAEFVRRAMRDLVLQLGEQDEPLPSDSVDTALQGELPEPVRRTRVVLLPAADEADETVALMLKQLLDRRGFQTTVIDDDTLASEKLEAVVTQRADVVLVSALPPRAVARARYLVKRLQSCDGGWQTEAAVLVGLWGVRSEADKITRRLCGTGESATLRSKLVVVGDLAEAAEAVRQKATVIAAKRFGEREDNAAGDGGRPELAPVTG
ncbi:MAG: hypothetical protein AAGK78_05555, partial [Planctomycetota bacterium]